MEPVFIKLDKNREIRFGNKAMIEFQSLTGISVLTAFQKMDENSNVDILMFNQLLYVALIGRNPDITSFEQVIDLVDEYLDFGTLIKKCMEAFEKSGFFTIPQEMEVIKERKLKKY